MSWCVGHRCADAGVCRTQVATATVSATDVTDVPWYTLHVTDVCRTQVATATASVTDATTSLAAAVQAEADATAGVAANTAVISALAKINTGPN